MTSTLTRRLKRNKISLVFGATVLGCFALNSGEIQKNMAVVGQVRQIAQVNAAKDMQLRVSQQAAQMQAEIANERYTSGCLMVVTTHDPGLLASLAEGQPVLDGTGPNHLPLGTIVCDAHGNTAKIVAASNGTPVAGEIAFTGNRELVAAARRQAAARYVLPKVPNQ